MKTRHSHAEGEQNEQEHAAGPEEAHSENEGHGALDGIRREIKEAGVDLAETVEALADKADVKTRLSGGISHVKETVAEKKGRVADTLGETKGRVADTVVETKDRVADELKRATPESAEAGAQVVAASARRKPAPFAAGVLVAGLLLVWLWRRR